MRLDKYLAQTYTKLSRHSLKQAIKNGWVHVNGQIVDPDYTVSSFDKVDFNPDKLIPEPTVAEKINLKIIFENADFMVVEKPSGMVVEPGVGHQSGTLVNALLNIQLDKELDRAGLVHRLDKETSGLILVAKNVKTQRQLSNLFKDRLINKEYLALVKGKLDQPAGEINAPIGRDLKNILKYAVRPDGKESMTRYFTERILAGHTLLRLIPQTGRTHQIRVHLVSLHKPIYGDTLYDGESGPRLFLHATKLQFRLKGKDWSFESPLPPELEGILKNLA